MRRIRALRVLALGVAPLVLLTASCASRGATTGATRQPGAAGLLACASPGNCAMGGSYPLTRPPANGDAAPTAAFVVTEVNGAWGKALEAPGTARLNTGRLTGVSAVSCAPRGPCTVAGYYNDRRGREGAYFLNETGGVWGPLQQVRGIAPLTGGSSRIWALSCPRAGGCSAVGLYTTTSGHYYLFVVSQRAG
jgi:hypothetical protein